MKKLSFFGAFLFLFAWGSMAGAAQSSISADLEALQQALDRMGEGVPADPRAHRSPAHRGVYNAMEFGAKGDGVADDTMAIQKALNAAADDGGGTVELPTGEFLIKTHLVLPPHVSLQGVWRKPQRGEPRGKGTVLLAVEGKGNPDGTPFIVMKSDTCLAGVTIFYPEQIRANPPHAYPWTIQGQGDDCGILNVTMVSSFQAVDFGTFACGRHYVDGLYAHALKMGIYVDQCYDVGRLNNIHFWPFYDLDPKSPLWEYTRTNGTSFKFGRTDGELVSNCFSIFYGIGMHMIGGPIPQTKPGEPLRVEYQGGSAAFTNLYLDVSPCALKVDDSMENAGYSFTNSFFMSKVVVGPRNRGPIRFNGCGFWATSDLDTHAAIEGTAPVYFEACHFANWDRAETGAPCIDANARRVIITGCDFLSIRPNLTKVRLGPNVRDAVVTSNLMSGGVSIVNEAPRYADVQIGLNAGNKVDACIRRWTILGPFPNPAVTPAPQGDAPTRAGYDTDYLTSLGGEAAAVIKPGATVDYEDEQGVKQTVVAVNVPTNDAARLDFARRLKANGKVAYAYAEFEAQKAETIDVLFGSADSAKVWVNGELVHRVWTPGRLFAPAQDKFSIRAQRGVNRILVKVEDGSGTFWEFMVEARDKKGKALLLLDPNSPRAGTAGDKKKRK